MRILHAAFPNFAVRQAEIFPQTACQCSIIRADSCGGIAAKISVMRLASVSGSSRSSRNRYPRSDRMAPASSIFLRGVKSHSASGSCCSALRMRRSRNASRSSAQSKARHAAGEQNKNSGRHGSALGRDGVSSSSNASNLASSRRRSRGSRSISCAKAIRINSPKGRSRSLLPIWIAGKLRYGPGSFSRPRKGVVSSFVAISSTHIVRVVKDGWMLHIRPSRFYAFQVPWIRLPGAAP